ncbi:MAG: nuclear transport factor 2 family protein [Anaerolineae bacterium]
MKADSATENQVLTAVDGIMNAYADHDIHGLLSRFAADDDIVMYGTGRDERRVGPAEIREQAERDWAQADSIAMRFDERNVWTAGDVAWVALDGAFELAAGGQTMELPARVSLVFEKRDGDWLAVHGHFSTPAAGQEVGQSF